MSFDFTLDVTDLTRYSQRLEQAGSRISRAGRRNAGKWAKQGARIAARLAPVDTGELKASIGVQGTDIVATARHAGFVEFGTVRMPPQPFMRPAVQAIRRPFQEEQLQIAASFLGSKTAARTAVVGAVGRGTAFGQSTRREASVASIQQGGLP